MATKKQIAIIAATLSLLPPSVVANAQEIHACDPNKILNRCEKSLYDAAITWEGRSEETRSALNGCLDKLAVRTSTVINKLILPTQVKETDMSRTDIVILSGVGMLGFTLGILAGTVLAR